MVATIGKRGCGDRVAGGVYLSCPTSDHGHPTECFLLDPPKPIEAAVLGLSPRGVTLFDDASGRTHVMDWIGAESYPNVADFIEETRRLGVSRRIAKTEEFARLGPGSKLFVVHARALITNPADYYQALPEQDWYTCPATTAFAHCGRGQAEAHRFGAEMDAEPCGRLWWHDVAGGELSDLGCWRTIGSTVYPCAPTPEGVTPRYELAIFGAFPIKQIEVVADHEGTGTESAMIAASQARLPLILCDE